MAYCDHEMLSSSIVVMKVLENSGRKQIITAGIEAHICVYQTSVDLMQKGYEVEVAADCVSSRTKLNMETALAKMRDKGVSVTTAEMCLFELMGRAEGDVFKSLLRIVK